MSMRLTIYMAIPRTRGFFSGKESWIIFYRNLDPDDNFESDKAFFSDKDFDREGLTSQSLFDNKITLDFDEIVSFKADDPSTEDVDESTEVDQRLSPRIRIPLDSCYIPTVDSRYRRRRDMLLDNNRFQEYFNGIVIGLQSTATPLMMQLNFGAGVIKIEYDYKELVLIDGGNASNVEDYESQDSSSAYSLKLERSQI